MAPRRRNPPPGENPLFSNVPTLGWCMSSKPRDMRRGHGELYKGLKKMLGKFGVKITEEDGRVKVFDFHKLPPETQFFKVKLEVRRCGSPPLLLVFNLRNLYLVGFLHANVWYVFDDADLTGSGYDVKGNEQYWAYLGIKGRYHGNMFNHVELGIEEIHSIYSVLSRYHELKSQGKEDTVDTVLFRCIVVLSEAWRFPRWRACLYCIFMYSPRVVDRMPLKEDDGYETLFKMWKKICKRVVGGADQFHTFTLLPGYNTYPQLLPVVSILLYIQGM